MRKGGKPKNPKLRLIVGGNTSKLTKELQDKLPKELVRESEKFPSKPKSLTPGASKVWDFVCGLIDEMGILSRTDTISIQLLCEAYADYVEAQEAIKKNGGPTYKTQTSRGKGVIVRNIPAVRQRNDADYRIRSWMTEFGMTPAARARVPAGRGSSQDPADKYFGQSRG